jgi:hypothetical protein
VTIQDQDIKLDTGHVKNGNMKKSELRHIIREVIQEQFKGKKRPNVTPQARGKSCYKIVQHADGVTYHCEEDNTFGAGNCGINYYVGAWNGFLYNSMRSCEKAMMTMGLQFVDTPDFDQSFYDDYEGEYGPFPGQGINLNKNFK